MSALRAEVINPITDPRWAEMVGRAADAGIFHHPAWLRILRDQYRYPIWACSVGEHNGSLLGGLPIATVRSRLTGTRLVAVPFSDLSPPLYDGREAELSEELMAAVETERERRGLDLEVHAEVAGLAAGGPGDRFYHHTLSLGPDFQAVMQRVHKSKTRGARTAERRGVVVQRRTDGRALEQFFRMHVLTRRKQGVPTQPRRFFRRLAGLFDEGLGYTLLAEWEGRAIAAAVYLQFNGVLTYKYGASDPKHLDKHANSFVYLEAIRYACESDCRTLDLGRTELDNPGLRQFKRQFGAAERELSYTRVPPRRSGSSVRSVSPLQRAAIRHAPPVFGRLLGASLYRHFG